MAGWITLIVIAVILKLLSYGRGDSNNGVMDGIHPSSSAKINNQKMKKDTLLLQQQMDFLKNHPEIQKEMDWIYKSIDSGTFEPGKQWLYLGKGMVKKEVDGSYIEQEVVISVGYKIDYCIKCALRFCLFDKNVRFDHISKVKLGDLKTSERFFV